MEIPYGTTSATLVSAKDNNALQLKEIRSNPANCHNFNYSEGELRAIVEYLK